LSMSNSTTINMLEDVVLLDIDGISPIWDTYSFCLDIASPGPKVSRHLVDTDWVSPNYIRQSSFASKT
ncbi:hypothetical protein CY34DRAFT_85072, partial [Suillus luteus UH-Slu-Lm8-n1]